MKVLILNVSTGYGHKSVSRALDSYLSEYDIQVDVVDMIEYINPFLNKIVQTTYLTTLKYIPDILSRAYKKEIKDYFKKPNVIMDGMNQFLKESDIDLGPIDDNSFSDLVNATLMKGKFFKLLERIDPDWIILTHPFLGDMIDTLEEKRTIHAKKITIVTDYLVHPSWLNHSSDYIILAHPDLAQEVAIYQANSERFRYFGIPVKPIFYQKAKQEKPNKKKMRAQIGLNHYFTYLFMGGGEGLGKIKDSVHLLLDQDANSNVVVICGKNENLYDELLQMRDINCYRNLYVYGFVSNVEDFMQVADVLITKPGGITTTEAILMDLPIIFQQFLPGQEEKNAFFLLNHHLGIYANDNVSFLAYCQLLRNNDSFYDSFVQSIKKEKNMRTLDQIHHLLKNG